MKTPKLKFDPDATDKSIFQYLFVTLDKDLVL